MSAGDAAPASPRPATAGSGGGRARALPRGRLPSVGLREIVAALHRRRERRRHTLGEMRAILGDLAAAVERHEARVDALRRAVEAQGGDVAPLQHYDSLMARLRAELREAERSLADAFRSAAAASGA